MAPKNTIWCTAMPRARMKLGRIICTDAPLLAITVIQQAPFESAHEADDERRHGERGDKVATALDAHCPDVGAIGPEQAVDRRHHMAPATAPTPNTA
jgi:hypothetical protein